MQKSKLTTTVGVQLSIRTVVSISETSNEAERRGKEKEKVRGKKDRKIAQKELKKLYVEFWILLLLIPPAPRQSHALL